jgi:pimeloyl-ACP methyl ester carboxylesterase
MPADFDRQVKTSAEAIALLEEGTVTAISLDHDLGESGGTGYEVACWIEEAAYEGRLAPIEVTIHSANPVGRVRMEQAIARARQFWSNDKEGGDTDTLARITGDIAEVFYGGVPESIATRALEFLDEPLKTVTFKFAERFENDLGISMKSNDWVIYFAHGKESGPWGSKIQTLAAIARARGFRVDSPDYSDLSNPDDRVGRLLAHCGGKMGNVVLVGSSMGAYVSTVASAEIRPAGLFLMAPAFYLDGYADQDPTPHAEHTVIVHGWNDEVVPVENAIKFASKHRCELHVVDSNHRIVDKIPFVADIFRNFLDRLPGPL